MHCLMKTNEPVKFALDSNVAARGRFSLECSTIEEARTIKRRFPRLTYLNGRNVVATAGVDLFFGSNGDRLTVSIP
jgi:hypothetical protein